MYAIGTRPFSDAIVGIREFRDEAEDEASRHNAVTGRNKNMFKVFKVLVHFVVDGK